MKSSTKRFLRAVTVEIYVLLVLMTTFVSAQPEGAGPPISPRLRYHEAVRSSGHLELVAATAMLSIDSQVTIEVRGDIREIKSNGIPMHKAGTFPNAGNPNSIHPQAYIYTIAANPQWIGQPFPLRGAFGVCVNGVPLDPGAAEFFHGDPMSGWQYEALSGAGALGLDDNHAHVQPTGAYHYHAMPTLLLSDIGLVSTSHSPLVGWAADGFPIYALYGTATGESITRELLSSYRTKTGNRASGKGQPGGIYDGTFTNDYEYVKNSGDLDECNGTWVQTPEFPDSTYAYFLTNDFPYVPRCYMGIPSTDFAHGGPRDRPTSVWSESWGRLKKAVQSEP